MDGKGEIFKRGEHVVVLVVMMMVVLVVVVVVEELAGWGEGVGVAAAVASGLTPHGE